jgi:hypothetical protein
MLCVSYEQHNLSLRHPEDDEAMLSVVLSIVKAPMANASSNTVFASSKLTP